MALYKKLDKNEDMKKQMNSVVTGTVPSGFEIMTLGDLDKWIEDGQPQNRFQVNSAIQAEASKATSNNVMTLDDLDKWIKNGQPQNQFSQAGISASSSNDNSIMTLEDLDKWIDNGQPQDLFGQQNSESNQASTEKIDTLYSAALDYADKQLQRGKYSTLDTKSKDAMAEAREKALEQFMSHENEHEEIDMDQLRQDEKQRAQKQSETIDQQIADITGQINQMYATKKANAPAKAANGSAISADTESNYDEDSDIEKLEKQKATLERSKTYSDNLSADDFEEKSKYIPSDKNSETYEAVNALFKNKNSDTAFGRAAITYSFDDMDKDVRKVATEQMSYKELQQYNYIYQTKGEDAANEYIHDLAEGLNYAQGLKEYRKNKENDIVSLADSVGYGIGKFGEGFAKLANGVKDDEATPTSVEDYKQALKKENASKGWSMAYDLAETTGNMLPSIVASAATAGVAGAAGLAAGAAGTAGAAVGAGTMGVSAGGNAFNEEWKNGTDKKDAAIYGAVNGTMEAGMQYFLGGIGKIGGGQANGLLTKAVDKVSKGKLTTVLSKIDGAFTKALGSETGQLAYGTAKELGTSMFEEGREEYLQEALDPIVRNITLGENNDPLGGFVSQDALYAGFLGAASAGLFEGVSVAGKARTDLANKSFDEYRKNAANAEYESIGRSVNDYDANIREGLMDYAKTAGEDLSEFTDAYEVDQTDINLGKLKIAVDKQMADPIVNAETVEEAEKAADKLLQEHPDNQYVHAIALEAYAQVEESFGIDQAEQINATEIGNEDIIRQMANEAAGVDAVSEDNSMSVPENNIESDRNTMPAFENEMKSNEGNNPISVNNFTENTEHSVRPEQNSQPTQQDIEKIIQAQESQEQRIQDTQHNFQQINRMAEQMEYKDTANAYVKNYSANISPHVYHELFSRVQNMALAETEFTEVQNKLQNDTRMGIYTDMLGENALRNIYDAGVNELAERTKVTASKEQQETVQTFARALGIDLEIRDSIDDGHGNHANGMYLNGKMYLSKNSVNMLTTTAAHEATHRMKNVATEEYQAYEDYIVNTIRDRGEYDGQVEHYKKLTGSEDISLIHEEMAAEATETFLNEPDKFMDFARENTSAARKLVDVVSELIDKLKAAVKNLNPSSRAAQLISEDIDTYTEARDLWYEGVNRMMRENGENTNETEGGSEKYSIKETESGIRYVEVDTDQDLFDGIEEREYPQMAMEVIRERFQGKVIGEDANRAFVNGESRKEYAYPAKKNMEKRARANKMRASTELDNLMKASVFAYHADDGKDGHIHNDAEGGFDYYKVIFKFNENIYEGLINIQNTKKGRIFKDITKLKEISGVSGQTNKSNTTSPEISSINNISDLDKNVNRTPKFSLKSSVEETEDLIAVHNLSEKKLKGVLELGGFPMPSIAIMKASQSHDNFGEISVLFRKDTVDPEADKANRVYSGDAWTPTFPDVEYQYSEDTLQAIADEIGTSIIYVKSNILQEGPEAAIKKLKTDRNTKERFLQKNNITVEPVLHTPSMSVSILNNDKIKSFFSRESVSLHSLIHDSEIRSEFLDLVRQSTFEPKAKRWMEKFNNQLNAMASNPDEYKKYAPRYEADLAIAKGKAEAVEDQDSYSEGVDNAIREHVQEYDSYVQSLAELVHGDKWILNGQTRYNDDGFEKAWEETHYSYTLDNIVKVMAGQDEQGAGVFMSGFGNMKGVSYESYNSINEIKEDTGRLEDISEEQKKEIQSNLTERFDEIVRSITDNQDDFIALDTTAEVIADAVKKAKTASGILKEIRKYNKSATEITVRDIIDLIQDIRSMPVEYFEAKPKRAVEFDEVAAVVIPKTLSEETKTQIRNHDMRLVEYDPTIKSSRSDACNSVEGIRFSLKVNENIPLYSGKETYPWDPESYESKDFVETASILQEGTEALRSSGKEIDQTAIHNIAQEVLNDIGSQYDIDTLSENLEKIFSYMQNRDNVSYEDVVRVMSEVALPVVEEIGQVNESQAVKYEHFKAYVKSTPFKLSDTQKAEIRALEDNTFNWMSDNRQYMNFSNDGVDLDSGAWSELVRESGYQLPADANEAEMPLILSEFMEGYQPNVEYYEVDGATKEDLAYDVALNIFSRYFGEYAADEKVQKALENRVASYKQKVKREVEKSYKKEYENVIASQKDSIDFLKGKVQELIHEKQQAIKERDKAKELEVNEDLEAIKQKLADVKEMHVEEIARIKAKNRVNMLRRSYAKKETDLRNKIKKVWSDLQKRTTCPTDSSYVPEGLLRAVLEVCTAVDVQGNNRIMAQKMGKLRDLYESMAPSAEESAYDDLYDGHLYEQIKDMQSRFQNRSLRDLTYTDLQQVYDTMSAIKKQVIQSTKLIGQQKNIDAYQAAEQEIKFINAVDRSGKGEKAMDKLLHGMTEGGLSPVKFKSEMKRLVGYREGSALVKAADAFNQGTVDAKQIAMETEKIFDPVLKETDKVRELVGQKSKDWVDFMGIRNADGTALKVPKSMVLSLAMHVENKQNLKHIIWGGLRIPNAKLYAKGKKDAYKRGQIIKFGTADAYRNSEMSRDEIEEICEKQIREFLNNTLTEYDKQYLEASKKFFWDYSGKKINETSKQLKGYTLANVKNYFPINTDKSFTKTEVSGLLQDGTIEGMGMLKSRVSASNPINLEAINDVIERHTNNVAKYCGYAIPIRNFNKIYNTTLVGYQDSISNALGKKWGNEGQLYIERFMTDLQSHRGDQTIIGDIADKLRGNYAGYVLTGNFSVMIKQAASLPTAAYKLGWSNMAAALPKFVTNKGMKADFDKISQYTSLLWDRTQGTFNSEMMDIKKHKPLLRIPFVTDLFLNGIQHIDERTVGSLWYAAESKAKKENPNLKPDTDLFYQKVAEIFNEAVLETQPMYDATQQTDISRNPSKLFKQLFMFKTQPMQNFNIMYDATSELHAKAKLYKKNEISKEEYQKSKKNFALAMSSQAMAAITFSTMSLLAGAFYNRLNPYKDDEGKITLESASKKWIEDIISSIAGSFVGGTELYDLITSTVTDETYYGITIAMLENISDMQGYMSQLIEGTSDMLSNDKNQAELGKRKAISGAYGMTKSIAQMTGTPVENVQKCIEAVTTRITDWKFEKEWTDDTTWLKDNDDRVIDAAKLRLQGDTAGYREILDEIKAEGYKQDDVIKAINAKYNELTKSESSSSSKAQDIYKAVDLANALEQNGEDTQKIIDDMVEIKKKNGTKDPSASIKSVASEVFKEKYQSGSEEERTAIQNQLSGLTVDGKEIFDQDYFDRWSNVYSGSDVTDKLDKGDITGAQDIINQMYETKYGIKLRDAQTVKEKENAKSSVVSSIKSSISSNYKEVYIQGDSKTRQQIIQTLNQIRVDGKKIFGQEDYLRWNKESKK